ncbi:hypothetical protein CWE09_12270 [Aliidiomarina minuta]|uniref:Uncharacterized protein n=1 Tax=Aliidiomarina minuta TaxID=880057 RepID=A0A432W3S0_9GAMM|nr:hypothetical protein [Aliidiomarina minuta]RUO23919.1 hypothetical protein CWE09_12270 [Aliidiomarina minuta]
MTGRELEKNGWRQGSILNDDDAIELAKNCGFQADFKFYAVVSSQSCDIANNNPELEPYVEVYFARADLEALDGNFEHNKNARLLHTKFLQRTEGNDLSKEKFIEIKAFDKKFIPKDWFNGRSPDSRRAFEDYDVRNFSDWLAARYSRPALPSEFNRRLNEADPKGVLRKKAKKATNQLSGMYVEIHPFDEIGEEERYRVNLLGTLVVDYDGDLDAAESALESHANVLRAAGMDVICRLAKEDEISIALIRRFKRFYYDDLSFSVDAPLPAEARQS